MITNQFIIGILAGIAIAYFVEKLRGLIKELFIYREIMRKDEGEKIHHNK